ncbi:MAG: cytochrome c maturation protein CcmE [Steroidobacteraceae bacterium]
MTPRRKRLIAVVAVLAGVGAAVALALRAFDDNVMYFYSPTQIEAGEAPSGRAFRVGGLVENGSVRRRPGDLTVEFSVTDNLKRVTVQYTGLLPDLFREGQGVIAHGRLGDNGRFVADEVLAKHDENYMPPEVAASLHQKPAAGAKP